jgi:hypothetical protein
VDLEILSRTGDTLRAVVPTEPIIAPPGFYMLFLVDNALIPSEARWIRLQP